MRNLGAFDFLKRIIFLLFLCNSIRDVKGGSHSANFGRFRYPPLLDGIDRDDPNAVVVVLCTFYRC